MTDAYWMVKGWDTGNTSKYTDLYTAALNGQDLTAHIRELAENGKTKKEVLSELKSQIGTWYTDPESDMTFDNLERYVLLCKAMKYIDHTDREFTEADAREWVKHMDPPARWTMEQTTAVMKQYGYSYKPCVFYAVMNMLWSDYCKTAVKHGMDNLDFWVEMAHDFIDDHDAVDMKVGKYWRDIVGH